MCTTRGPKSEWAQSCLTRGRMWGSLRGGCCFHSCSTSWWMDLRAQCTMQLQEFRWRHIQTSGSPSSSNADDLVLAAECEFDLQTALDAVAAWGFKFRFSFGIGPTKSVVMVFGPRRNLPTCSVILGGVELPVVSMHKHLGVVLTPTLCWTQHAQHLVQHGNRLFTQCVFWCRSERLPLAMASSIFMENVLPSVSWGTEFFSHSPPASRQLDHALRWWGRFLLGWPSGSPSVGVLAELGWPDAERLSTGRLLSLSLSLCSCMSISQWPEVSAPWNRLPHCCRSRRKLGLPRTRIVLLCWCSHAPHVWCGPGCLPSLAQRWYDSQATLIGQRFPPSRGRVSFQSLRGSLPSVNIGCWCWSGFSCPRTFTMTPFQMDVQRGTTIFHLVAHFVSIQLEG